MLQEAVDALFDNGKTANAVKGQIWKDLWKSLSGNYKVTGRFRQNLLVKGLTSREDLLSLLNHV